MSIVDKFGGFLNNAKQTSMSTMRRFTNKNFLDAVVAGCALVAAADGNISASEKQTMVGLIQNSEALKVFKTAEVIERFNHFASGFEFDPMIGKQEALKAMLKIKGNQEEAKMCVTICCTIGSADGNFDRNEQQVVRDIYNALGLSPTEFGI